MSSARRLYRINLALALIGGATVLVAVLVALTRLKLSLPSGQALVAACRGVVPFQSGLAMLFVLALATLGLVVATLALRSLLRQLREQRRVLRALRPLQTTEIAGHEVTVIAGERPRAFCAGLLRPRIYLSVPTLEALSAAELRAVLAHEGHHQAKRDPLRILSARVLAEALFFLPGLRRLSQRYRELAELAADEAATRSADGHALAAALLTLGARGGEAVAVAGIAPERVDHLLGQSPRWQLPPSVFAGSLGTVTALLAAVVTLPSLADQGSISLAALLAEGCMASMLALPLAVGTLAFSLSRRHLRHAPL